MRQELRVNLYRQIYNETMRINLYAYYSRFKSCPHLILFQVFLRVDSFRQIYNEAMRITFSNYNLRFFGTPTYIEVQMRHNLRLNSSCDLTS